MKKLILCEGPNEKTIMDILLDNELLGFGRDDLIGAQPYHARQIDRSKNIMVEIKAYNEAFEILRVGDKLADNLRISKEIKNKVTKVEKYCTKPELEFLLIITAKLRKEFEKSNFKKAKEFAKANVVFNRRRYDNSSQFYLDYYGNRPQVLIEALIEYKRIKVHEKEELYLIDLIDMVKYNYRHRNGAYY